MRSRRVAKASLAAAVVTMVLSVAGFVVALVLNAFFLDDYNAYGEVAIPGSSSLHLPRGEVTISLHAVVIGSPNGGLPVPPLGVTITPPDGVAQPAMTENIGSTTTVNNDSHVRVWVAQIPAEGNYNITTDGQVNGFIQPRLAFGHSSSLGYLIWIFVAVFVVALAVSIVSGRWLARTRRRAATAVVQGTWPAVPVVPVAPPAPVAAHEPTDEGIRLERLKTLAALRDSGALTDDEFQTEKRRILQGY
ncbi:hypothetical protein BN1232_03560 [Mycobacterium rhizamassiliense]|uniref:SHOCT domain-containing protein n=1 Tax=Mycobacterium rhizamassiliense TaxID=1841860 RepID=A0A2U3NXC1_9MYCO|nr:SHOCT domain-containing protein [Mycobacterium rhizamassiliense]SPM36166.1 hypothetical protein BN1232_03560 [Mycobacterium rhizamassiliense]